MIEKTINNFSLEQILKSGQCFRMKEIRKNLFEIIKGKQYLRVFQKGSKVYFYCTEKEYEEIWKEYFDLDTDYGAFIKQADPGDKYLQDAIRYGSGIRILHQEVWEMIVSFIISQQNNISRIRKCIENICEKYGEELKTEEGDPYYSFPLPEAFAVLEEDELKECNLGYRSKYVVRTAKMITEGRFDLEKIKTLPYEEARNELLQLFGVGVKVADCICLFGLHHLQAFPVDTHIKQAVNAHYSGDFPREKYQGTEGVMQQYIFFYELYGKKEKENDENV